MDALAEHVARFSAERTRIDAAIDRSNWTTTSTTTKYGGAAWTIAERSSWPPDLPLEVLRRLVRIEQLDANIRELRRDLQALERAARRGQ